MRLLTLGGLSLQVGDQLITGAATQRRRIALFAILAVAGDRGMSRDRLLATLWPESEAERARHVLAQLLYAQRKELAQEDLFLGNKTLRLNAELLSSDVGDFQRALAAGDAAAAVRLYEGRFLDGFHLPDTPAFDHWAEGERTRLAAQAAGAAEGLARGAEAGGETAAAIGWWRAAARAEPYSARYAAGLIAAMMAAGDRASAMHHARSYEAFIARELELPVDVSVRTLMDELRSG
jgi:DNA-binding SARP family transcriptional activator